MKLLVFIFLLIFSIGCLAQIKTNDVEPTAAMGFKSDGCSWFPDGNYRDCCVIHDTAYFSGGSWKMRLKADNKLFKCVAKKKGWYQPLIAPFMWAGVRTFGVSFLPTSFRWGFGKKKSNKMPEPKKNASPKYSK